MRCDICGATGHATFSYNEKMYCISCLHDNDLEYCLKCSKIFPLEDMVSVGNESWCPECAENDSFTCQRCDSREDIDNLCSVDGQDWCNSCFDNEGFICSSCEEGQRADSSYVTINGDRICRHCYRDNYFTCSGCGYVIHQDHYGQNRYCVDCCEEEENNDAIHPYHYKPAPIFHREVGEKKHNALYFGIELEVNGNQDNADTVLELSNDENLFWLEHDSSISGFEIVTHPCTLEYHKKSFPWLSLTTLLKDNGFKSHDTDCCGLHIHVSKNRLSKTDQIKLGLFVGFNWEVLQKFGRRDYNCYCRRKNIVKGEMKYAAESEMRYDAINFTNYRTVEFRFFRGTLRHETILASLEFVHALYGYVKTNGFPTIVKPCRNEFIDYCSANKYATLLAYMDYRGIGKVPAIGNVEVE